MEIKLNPAHDAEALAKTFNEKRRIQISDFLEPESAERVYQCLAEETPWLTAYRDDGQDHMISEEQLRAMDPHQMQAFQAKLWSQARDDFEFIYGSYPLNDERLRKQNPDLYLYNWVDLVNSEDMLALIRKITGLSKLKRADAQGTWYRKGQFLTLHNDFDPSDEGKRVAYVMSFCREWRPDWGGFLQFYDDEMNITDGFMPRFNAISMFETPQNHSVSFVTPFCGNRRLSITGWFRDQ